MLSIILPTYNETQSGCLDRILQVLDQLQDAEIIVIDGGSGDGTVAAIEQYEFKLLEAPGSSRAARLNRGIAESSGDIIFLHHPRSLVSPEAFAEVIKHGRGEEKYWGGLTHRFDHDHPVLRFTSWYSNRIRCDHKSILYLDHCIFFHRRFKQLGLLIPDVEIFEDTKLSLLLQKHARPVRLPVVARTSAIRFTSNGIYRQSLLNQLLKIAHTLKVSPQRMNRLYERGLDLNQ